MSKDEKEDIKIKDDKKDSLNEINNIEDGKNDLFTPNNKKLIHKFVDNNLKENGLGFLNSQIIGQLFGDPNYMQLVRNFYSDPNLVNTIFQFPQLKTLKENNPLLQTDPSLMLKFYSPENAKLMSKVLLEPYDKKDNDEEEKKSNENDEIDENLDEEYKYYADKYKDELIQLKSFGFKDIKLNIDLLNECEGNFNDVLKFLLEN